MSIENEESLAAKKVRDSKRMTFLKNALGLEPERAYILDRFIQDIPDKELNSFLTFRYYFNEEKLSKEMVTLKAYLAYKRKKVVADIQAGDFVFKNFDEMVEFIKTHFKNADLTKGAKGFQDHTILRINNQGRMVNSYAINENGFEKVVSIEEEVGVYEWLFINQNKIGYAPLINNERKRILEEMLEKKLAQDSGLHPSRENKGKGKKGTQTEDEVLPPEISSDDMDSLIN